jgi:hypothetical protein
VLEDLPVKADPQAPCCEGVVMVDYQGYYVAHSGGCKCKGRRLMRVAEMKKWEKVCQAAKAHGHKAIRVDTEFLAHLLERVLPTQTCNDGRQVECPCGQDFIDCDGCEACQV